MSAGRNRTGAGTYQGAGPPVSCNHGSRFASAARYWSLLRLESGFGGRSPPLVRGHGKKTGLISSPPFAFLVRPPRCSSEGGGESAAECRQLSDSAGQDGDGVGRGRGAGLHESGRPDTVGNADPALAQGGEVAGVSGQARFRVLC